MFGLGPWELVVILVIVVILFGVGKLPELGTGLGEGIRNFKKSYRDSKTLDVTPENSEEIASADSDDSGEKKRQAPREG